MESGEMKFWIDMDENNIIGKGGFGTVRPAYEINDTKRKRKYAAKSVPEHIRTNEKEMTAFGNEILVSTQFENENLVKFYGLTEVDNVMYMIFEYCNGGDLNNFSKKYKELNNEPIKERDALLIIKGITNGLYCLHRNNIIHHDIKPANILLKFDTDDALKKLDLNHCSVKISDFGLAKFRASDDGSGIGGTPTYMDPIIIIDRVRDPNKTESDKTDIWSLGILSYKLLFENHPFIEHYAFKNKTFMKVLHENIKKGKYTVPINQTNKISLESICFIDSCLKREQEFRKSSEELAYSRFLTRPYEKFNFIIQDNVEEIIQNENLREKNEYILLNIYEKEYFEQLIDI
jgi:serine/threonine protein kinase